MLNYSPKIIENELSCLDFNSKWIVFQNANIHKVKLAEYIIPYIINDSIPKNISSDSKLKFEFCKHFIDVIFAETNAREKQYSLTMRSINTASISISVKDFEKYRMNNLQKVLKYFGLTQDSHFTFLFQREDLFKELFAAYRLNPKIEFEEILQILWKHSKEKMQYEAALERSKAETARMQSEKTTRERIKQDKLRIALDSKARQERSINKHELLMTLNKNKTKMEGNNNNREAILDMLKELKEDDLAKKVKKCIDVFEGKSKCELLKEYLNGRKVNDKYRVTSSGKIDINDLSIADRFQKIKEGKIAIQLIADCFQEIARYIEQDDTTINLLRKLEEVLSICADTNKSKPERERLIYIIKEQFVYDVDPDGKNFFEEIDKFFQNCKAPKFLLPENRSKIETLIRCHYKLFNEDRTQGLFLKIQDFLIAMKSKHLTPIFSEIMEFLASQAMNDEKIQLEFETLFNQKQRDINSSNEVNLSKILIQLVKMVRTNPHLFGYQTNNIRNCIVKIKSMLFKHQSIDNVLMCLQSLSQNFKQMQESMDARIDNKLVTILKIQEGIRIQDEPPIKGIIDHYQENLDNLRELQENIGRLKEKIYKIEKDLSAEDKALLSRKEEQHRQAALRKQRKIEKAERRRQKQEKKPKQLKQTEQTRQSRFKYKEAVRARLKQMDAQSNGEQKRSIERSTVAVFSAQARESLNLQSAHGHSDTSNPFPESTDRSYRSALNVPEPHTVDEITNLSGRVQIQDYLDDLKDIINNSALDAELASENKSSNDNQYKLKNVTQVDAKDRTELPRKQDLAIKAQIYAIVFLIANVMDKIRDTQDNALFSESDAAFFRNRVFHDAIFRRNLTANYYVVHDLGLKILTYLSAKLSGRIPEEKQKIEIITLIRGLISENSEHPKNSEKSKNPERSNCLENPKISETNRTFIQNDIKTCKEMMQQGREELLEFEQYEATLTQYYGNAFEQVWSNAHALIYSEISAYFSEYLERCQTVYDKDHARIMKQMRKFHVPGNGLRHCKIRPSLELISELRLQDQDAHSNSSPTLEAKVDDEGNKSVKTARSSPVMSSELKGITDDNSLLSHISFPSLGTTTNSVNGRKEPNNPPVLLYLQALITPKPINTPVQTNLQSMLQTDFPQLANGGGSKIS